MKVVKLNENYYAIDVPIDAKRIHYCKPCLSLGGGIRHCAHPEECGNVTSEYDIRGFDLPATHTYTILGRESELSEDEAKEIVHFDFRIEMYLINEDGWVYHKTALSALASLCRSHGMENPLIIKTNKDD